MQTQSQWNIYDSS